MCWVKPNLSRGAICLVIGPWRCYRNRVSARLSHSVVPEVWAVKCLIDFLSARFVLLCLPQHPESWHFLCHFRLHSEYRCDGVFLLNCHQHLLCVLRIAMAIQQLKVKCVIIGDLEEGTVKSSGNILDFSMFYFPSPELATELLWPAHPNLSPLSVFFFVGLFGLSTAASLEIQRREMAAN